MKSTKLTDVHQTVIKVLKKEHLTSFEILNKVKDISITLEVYDVIDDLSNLGILKSYIKQDLKYHYIA